MSSEMSASSWQCSEYSLIYSPRMQVRRAEIPQVAAAVRELNEADADAIPIAYIVVQKMHHTRFFPADRNMDRSGNVLPGTASRHPSIIKSRWHAKQGHEAMLYMLVILCAPRFMESLTWQEQCLLTSIDVGAACGVSAWQSCICTAGLPFWKVQCRFCFAAAQITHAFLAQAQLWTTR